jgi:branched-chain amino acid transport system permease protein
VDLSIVLILLQDGIVNGAIYALLALALVLIFTVTRVIFIPQGEFVTYGALSLAALLSQHLPGTAWLLLGVGLLAFLMDVKQAFSARRYARLLSAFVVDLALPGAAFGLAAWAAHAKVPLWIDVLVVLALIVQMGPLIYRVAFQPVAEASVLVLLIVSVGVHFAMTGLGLVFFGAEGSRTPPFVEGRMHLGALDISNQSLFVVLASLLLIGLLYLLFERTLYGKALRATAVNRRGARLVAISTTLSGRLTFALAALIGAFSGMLIAPVTTVYYDSGFLIGLKGFVAAIIGGLGSYPLAAIGALLVGVLESFSSFWASAFKEVIVFTLIIPVLLWRSFAHPVLEDEE